MNVPRPPAVRCLVTIRFTALVLLLCASGASVHPASARSPCLRACVAPGLPTGEVRRAMLRQLNEYRATHGLEPLTYSKSLELAGDEHARDMHAREFFSHENPDGERAPERAMAAGFCHRLVGENIAYGMNSRETPQSALQAWIDSPGHDRNMRHKGYAYVGMGHYSVRVGGSLHSYWVQVFARK